MKWSRFSLLAVFALTFTVSAQAADSGVLTIGFTMSQTGKLNNDSIEQVRGFELWRDEVNAKGGIKVGSERLKIKFVSYDDESQNARVQQLYTRLITQDKAQFLFSPYSSGLTATAAIISEQYGKIMLTTGASEERTYRLGNKYLFQIYSPAGKFFVGPLEALKWKNPKARIAFVYEDDPFAKVAAQATRDLAKKENMQVVLDEAYASSTTNFGPVINKVIASKADTLFGGGHYADGSTLARQLHDQRANLKWVTLLIAPGSAKFAELGGAAEYISVPSLWEPQVRFKPDFGPTAQEFTAAFSKKFNIDPGYHAAGSYAAGLILQHAIERAGTIEPAKVAGALNAMDVMTMFGHTKFANSPEEHGLQIGHEMVVTQWHKRDGKLVREVVWPLSAKTADILIDERGR